MQIGFSRRVMSTLGGFSLSFLITLAACHHQINGGDDLSVPADLSIADLSSDMPGGPDFACTPEVTSCTGLCGPVHDNCTDQTFQCGACTTGMVCDLTQHQCVAPLSTCTALGRVCGTTKNNCGQTITCTPFTCPMTTQECDPNSNQCVTCENVSCSDLGYECGTAWLGCGPQSNTVNCGTCGAGLTCNAALNICEPTNGGVCGGMTPTQVCQAAKTSDGIQCGIISDGCGGLINCTTVDGTDFSCAMGLTCGGQGIPNQCAPFEPPSECTVSGYNCGAVQSACGGTLPCGTCPPGDVCNIAAGSTAGICGPACTLAQKSCAVDYAGKCGQSLADNCWPALNCPCTSPQVCSTSAAGAVGTCGTLKTCSDYSATGASGAPCTINGANTVFPAGNGSDLTCNCTNPGTGQGQQVCANIGTNGEGTCCTHPTCKPGDVTIADPCTGGTINCCPGGTVAYGGACCTPAACPNDGEYHPAFSPGCGKPAEACDCGRFPATPGDPTGMMDGEACCAAPTCTAGQCSGTSAPSTCSGKTVTCNAGCGSGMECGDGHTCCAATNACPADIYNPAFFDGCKTIVCYCPSGSVPARNSTGTIIVGAQCCTKPTACNGDCSGDVHHAMCGTSPPGTTPDPDESSAPVTCTGCGSGSCCNSTTKLCQTAGGACGNACPSVTDSCGNTITCNCPSGKSCTGGMCECPAAPACNAACPCPGGQDCTAGACCTPLTCANLPTGWQCGTLDDSCTGINQNCDTCTNGGTDPNSMCNYTTHLCECTPTKCCKDTGGAPPSCLPPGPYANDGCGNAGMCSS
jgi:hypothetical protein